jgi:hypothetical protein
MTVKLITLGLNRSGTKLCSYITSRAFALRRIHLEPFTYRESITGNSLEELEQQRSTRTRSAEGLAEHARLPVYCTGNEESPWLEGILRDGDSDVIKFVEIGRYRLLRRICPHTLCINVIREPIGLFSSLAGAKLQARYVAEQWDRLYLESGYDPLPHAGDHLPRNLAACARLYHLLYTRLHHHARGNDIRLSYHRLVTESDWLTEAARRLGTPNRAGSDMGQVGQSTRCPLSGSQERYLERTIQPVYETFLSPG